MSTIMKALVLALVALCLVTGCKKKKPPEATNQPPAAGEVGALTPGAPPGQSTGGPTGGQAGTLTPGAAPGGGM